VETVFPSDTLKIACVLNSSNIVPKETKAYLTSLISKMQFIIQADQANADIYNKSAKAFPFFTASPWWFFNVNIILKMSPWTACV
jgi:hypothetical protein